MNRMMLPLLAALVIGGLAGTWFAGYWQADPVTPTVATGNTPNPETSPDDDTLEAALAGARADLQREIEAREALETRLNAVLASQSADTITPLPCGEASSPNETPLAGIDALLDAGIDVGIATWLQERLDSIEMEELLLNERATSEGWRRSPRYQRKRRAIRAGQATLRDELNSDDTWDRLLYATHRDNRVVLQNIVQNSPAEQYGLQNGDSIIHYRGQRIFTLKEFNIATTEASAGTTVAIEVERNGQRLYLSLPNGQIGGRLQSARIRP